MLDLGYVKLAFFSETHVIVLLESDWSYLVTTDERRIQPSFVEQEEIVIFIENVELLARNPFAVRKKLNVDPHLLLYL